MDDKEFEKIVEEAKKKNFETEEEAKLFFDKMVKDSWSKTKIRK